MTEEVVSVWARKRISLAVHVKRVRSVNKVSDSRLKGTSFDRHSATIPII